MPTYSYACTGCSHRFEVRQSVSEAVLIDCPACAAKQLRKVISVPLGVVFRGSGFYSTDRGGTP